MIVNIGVHNCKNICRITEGWLKYCTGKSLVREKRTYFYVNNMRDSSFYIFRNITESILGTMFCNCFAKILFFTSSKSF